MKPAKDKKIQISIKLFILFVLLAVLTYFWLNAGRLLVHSDKPIKADLIVVLMGSGPDRILYAIDLFKNGYGSNILMVENNQPGYSILKERGVKLPRDTYLAKSVAVQLGVPERAVVILPGNALSTQDEAYHVRKHLSKHPNIKTVVIVSSKYHSTRAYKIFVRVFGDLDGDIKIISCPSKYDTFNENSWWNSREDAKFVVSEYAKLLAFYTIDRF